MPIQMVMYSIQFISILFLCIFSASAHANSIVYRPYNISKQNSFFVSKGDYSDLRISFRNDNQVNYWLIRKSNIQIEQYFENGRLTDIHLQQFGAKQVNELVYSGSNGKLKLIVARSRRPYVYNFSELNISRMLEKQMCSSKEGALDNLSSITKNLDDQVCHDNLENKIVNPICKTVLTPENYKNMVNGMAKAVNLNNRPSIGDCIKNDKTAENLAKNYNADLKLIKDKLKIIGNSYDLNAAKAYSDPGSLAGKITCKESPTAEPIAQTVQGQGIIFYGIKNKDQASKISKATYNRASVHELIHGAGVELDKIVQDLTAICVDGLEKVEPLSPKDDQCLKNKGCFFGVISQLDTQNHVNKVASNTPAVIPRELAETAIKNPPAEIINRPLVESKKQLNELAVNESAPDIAYQNSTNLTGGLINTTSKLLSAVSGGSIIPNAQAASGNLRSPASLENSSGATISKPSVVSSVGDDKFVAEEILAPTQSFDSNAKKTTEDKSVAADSRGVSKVQQRSSLVSNASDVSVGSSISGNADSSMTGVVNPGGGTSSGNAGSVDRGPASVNSIRNSKSTSNIRINADEVKSYLKNYESAKARLQGRDPILLKGLEVNGIKIVDPAGNVFGPKNGSIIYQDTGRSYEPL